MKRRLGVKKAGGQAVIPGNIIIRQRGPPSIIPVPMSAWARITTLFALTEGKVESPPRKKNDRMYVSVATAYTTQPNRAVRSLRIASPRG